MDIDRINTYSSKMIITAWFAGLAYYNWFASDPISVPIWAHAVLIIGGMFFASIVIGAGLSLVAAAITKAVTGDPAGSPHAFSWAAFIGMVISFMAAKYGLILFQGF
ncbi:hypothetical protein [Pelagimonas varians]|uniref:Uncharacterized protein n=1 Tax=Pelagimonas varians TaxID=696760 RepID=A0A238L8K9_9RHOB|nr:hypothetical protein [Pelagimonas varians]PYG24703.1 hypothetical protein C8N36_1458 [Pelagimonas varians]SMX50712.1 hypothetical protein PEV8663_04774 [Pelagimonas varians]